MQKQFTKSIDFFKAKIWQRKSKLIGNKQFLFNLRNDEIREWKTQKNDSGK